MSKGLSIEVQPNVSIIIPVYNRAKYVHIIINHLIKQTYKDFETIFVVNGNSEDDSLSVVHKEMQRLPNSKLIVHRENLLFGEARNIGAYNANGNLIWFLDIDDEPLSDFLKCMTDIQKKYDADIVICNFLYSTSDKTTIRFNDALKVKVMSRAEALIARSQEIIPVTAWSKLFRRKLIVDNDLRFKQEYSEDIHYTYEAIDRSKIVCFYNRPLYIYKINPNSVCNAKRTSDERGISEIKAYDDLEEKFHNDTKFFPMFRIRSSLIRLRSSGHMSYHEFMRYAKSDRCREMIKRNLTIPLSFEGIWYRVSPRTYYLIIRVFFKLEYYKDGRMFYKYCRWYKKFLEGW